MRTVNAGTRGRQGRLVLTLAWVALTMQLAQAAPTLEGFETSYLLKVSLFRGQVDISLQPTGNDNEYLYRNQTRATGMARIFRSGVSEESSRFLLTDVGLVPVQYDLDDNTNDPDDDSHVNFDWDAGVADSLHEGERMRLPIEPGILDRMSADIATILELRDGQVLSGFDLVVRNDIKRYEFQLLGEENIETPAGNFSAIKYLRQRPGSRRRTLIWFVPELCYQPAHIEQQKNDKTVAAMSLVSYSLGESCQPATPVRSSAG